MKKKWRVVPAALGLVVLLALAAAGWLVYKTQYEKTEIAAYPSGDGIYTLTVYQIGEPEFPFGSVKCRLILSRSGRRVSAADAALYNDGKTPGPENFSVSWKEESAEVTVKAEEAEDTVYSLYYDGRPGELLWSGE